MNQQQITKNKDCIKRERAHSGWYWFHKMDWLRTMSTEYLDTEPAYVHVPSLSNTVTQAINDRKERWGSGSSRKSNAQTDASMNAGDGQCAHVQISRTLAETSTTSAESAMVVDGRASECAEYPADIQFGQENRQGGELVGRPCEGYTCDGATAKPAESAQVMEVHASASGEGSPGAQMCG